MNEENVNLTKQEDYILLNWQKKSLIDMVREMSGDPTADGR